MNSRFALLSKESFVLSLILLAGCRSVPSSKDQSLSDGTTSTAQGKTSTKRGSDALKRESPLTAGGREVYMYAAPKAASSLESEALSPRLTPVNDTLSSTEAGGQSKPALRESGEPPLKELSLEALLEELEARFSQEWSSLPGGLGDVQAEEESSGRFAASRRLIAVSFLRNAADSKNEVLEEALRFAVSQSAKSDLKLLAAAYFTHSKQDGDALSLVSEICAEEPAGERGEGSGAPSFEVVALSFARSIDGPGKFIPAGEGDVLPGKVLLVYGEFQHFRSKLEREDGQEAPAFRQAFSASLRLVAPSGTEMDKLDFLPESRGRQTSSSPLEKVNFWARYRLPDSLKAGQYRLIVDAKDMLGGNSASRDLEFEIKGPTEEEVDRSQETGSSPRAASPSTQTSNRGGAPSHKKPSHP